MPQRPYNFASSCSIAFYANEYLLTANKHYERTPTHTNAGFDLISQFVSKIYHSISKKSNWLLDLVF